MSAGISGRHPASGRSITVTVENSRIAAIEPGPPDTTSWIAPGLVDLQVNGYAGIDLNAENLAPEQVSTLVRTLAAAGTTTMVPTLITASEPALRQRLQAIATARAADPLTAHCIPYVHVEGPFLSDQDGPRGAHPSTEIRPPDLAEVARWQAVCGGLVGMITLSPHWPMAPETIRALTAQGIRVAIGHTHAEPAQITAAADAGAVLSTHLGNGAAALLPRHPNLIWAQLADDRLIASLIADGHHLDRDTFTSMVRAKGRDRVVLVSDAAALAGLAPGVYDQPIGGKVELSADGRLSMCGTPFLAGATRTLAQNVVIAMTLGDLTLAQALRMATETPGEIVGQRRGRITVGASADLIRFADPAADGGLQILQAMVRGQWL